MTADTPDIDRPSNEDNGTPTPPEPPVRGEAEPVPSDLLEPVAIGSGEDEPVLPRKSKREGPIPAHRRRRRFSPLTLVCGCLLGCCLCCTLPFCALGAMGFTVAAVFEDNEVKVSASQAFDLVEDDDLNLTIENYAGQVTIRPTSSEQLSIEYTATAYALSKSDAQKALDDLELNFTQAEDTNDITVIMGADGRSFLDNLFDLQINYVDMTVYVPVPAHLDIKDDTGSVRVEKGVEVLSLAIDNDQGEIVFEGTLPPDENAPLSIQNDQGSIVLRLPADTFVYLQADADFGDITITGNNQNGRIDYKEEGSGNHWEGELGSGKGTPPTLTVRTDMGSIKVTAQ